LQYNIIHRQDVAELWEQWLSPRAQLDSADQIRFEFFQRKVLGVAGPGQWAIRTETMQHRETIHCYLCVILNQPSLCDN
jgi:hypothetical protein